MYFVFLQFTEDKKGKVSVDTKKVNIATKKIPYEAFLVLQKVVKMDTAAYQKQHETFEARLKSGHNKVKIPPISEIVQAWVEAVESYVGFLAIAACLPL